MSSRPFKLTPFTINLMWIEAERLEDRAMVNEKNSPRISQGLAISASNVRSALFQEAEYYNRGMPITA